MQIISSIIKNETVAPNGSRTITEEHTYDTGHTWLYPYVASATADVTAAMNQRAANINAALAAQSEAAAEAANFEVPLTMEEIMNRLTTTELATFYASTAAGMDVVRNIVQRWDGPVFRTHPRTQELMGIQIAAGIFTAERAAEILA